MVDGGMPPMTMNETMEMSNSSAERFGPHISSTSRPKLASHQSSSLPSTPYIGARTLAEDYRTPSPIVKGAEMTSPRSARSESDTGTRPPGKTPFLSGCKYETGMAFSRRRIPYSLGGDKLERASSTPKKVLQPNEEEKLSGDMRELYDRILPSPESDDRRAHFTKKLEDILNGQWPGNNIKAHVFGSSGNLLCTTDSDVDICITTPMKALERVCLLAKALAEHGMERVVCVPHAKVPIVKIWDPELKLSCDMNVNNTLALENTRMIKTYVQIDERVRPLAMVIKHWTQRRILNDAALGATLSSYTWICMIINFLQTRNPPVLPCLHHRPHQSLVDAEGKPSAFADDIETLRGFGNANKESTAQLLFQFFRRYAHEIDFDKHVISVREGSLILKQAKKWHLMQNNRLCVEEPFNTERNLGNTVDDISFRGVHLELRRAFDLLSQANLKECCEQYIFPPIKENIWSKPEPQPRPVLSRSHSQSGRAGKNAGNGSRGGHTSSRHRAGNQNRRASSAAVSNHMAFKSNVLPQALSNGLVSNERASGQQIQAQLLREMNYLQAQEAQLRLQLHQREQANIRLRLTAQNQGQMHQARGPIYPHHLNLEGLARQNDQYPAPMSAPLRNEYPVFSLLSSNRPGQRTVAPPSFPAIRTNPSSPSMVPAKLVLPEVRRGLHRSTTTDNNFGTLRSHSQPPSDMRIHAQAARPSQTLSPYPASQGSILGFNSLHQLQQVYLQNQQLVEMQQANAFATMSPSLSSTRADSRGDERNTRPPEYIGYYVEPSPLTRPHNLSNFPPISPYNDLSHFSRGVSPSMTRLRSHSSRSPSPSSFASGDKPLSFYSAASVQSHPSVSRRSADGIPTRRSGPIIIDGSSETSVDYGIPSESQSTYYSMTASDAASLSEDSLAENSRTPPGPIPGSPEQLDSFSLDQQADLTSSHSKQSNLQFGDFPVHHTGHRGLGSDIKKGGLAEMDAPSKPSFRSSPAEITTNGLGINLEEQLFATPTMVNGHSSPPKTQNRIQAIPTFGMSKSPPNSDHLPALKPMPLLSPVREVRTPSPTATRNSTVDSSFKSAHSRSVSALSGKDLNPSPLSIVTNGKGKASTGQGQEPKVNGINGYHDLGDERTSSGLNSPMGHQIGPSGWQQTGKKGKKSKSKGSISSLTELAIEERKGG